MFCALRLAARGALAVARYASPAGVAYTKRRSVTSAAADMNMTLWHRCNNDDVAAARNRPYDVQTTV